MAPMRRTDLALTALAVVTGLATLALQRSADADSGATSTRSPSCSSC